MLFTEPFQDSLIHSAFITSQNCQAAIKKEVKTSKEEKSGLGRLKSTLGRHILQTPRSNSLRLLAASPIAGMEFSTTGCGGASRCQPPAAEEHPLDAGISRPRSKASLSLRAI